MSYDEACAALRCRRTKLKELLRHKIIIRAEAHGREGLVTRASVEAELRRMAGVPGPRRARPKAKLAAVSGSFAHLRPKE